MADDLKNEPRHNTVAFLDANLVEAQTYIDMIQFLRRSRIYFAITADPPIYSNLIEDFWSSAQFHCETDPPCIRATVEGTVVEITEQIVRDVLRFGDVGEERTEFPMFLIRGCFLRMGYNGDINAAMMKKTHLPSTWRFLMHIIIVCLSNRKAGFDVLSHATQSAMTALVLNKPFNFSGLIFSYMKNNTSSRLKFLLYPRFIQLILDAVAPNLPKVGRRLPIIRM
ncbi:MAG TPA: hypothetical protein VIJ14_07250 [Rhabdochlamydiaceae bacterium]